MNDELRIGDEVEFYNEDRPNTVMVITKIGKRINRNGEWIDGIDAQGNLYACKNPKHWHKTGRYFPLMEKIFKQMRGEEE